MYYVYVLRCSDNSLYTGITTDVVRRVNEHYYKKKQSAKYTKSHDVVAIEAVWEASDKPAALRLERYIKSLSKADKEQLIKDNGELSDLKRLDIHISTCI